MSSPFVAEIRIFGFNFPPKGWALCDGQLLPISQNTALFSLLGTTYGGDGKSNFALPNLQGSAAMQPGQGPGLSLRDLGEVGGEDSVTLLQTEMPFHSHQFGGCNDGVGDAQDPTGAIWAKEAGRAVVFLYSNTNPNAMNPNAMAITGGSLPHNNLQPYLVLNFCIALQGIFPARP